MQITKMDGLMYKTLVINGAENLKLNYQKIDALNVFPVPDGDTGTNMRMTIESGVNEIKNLNENNIYEIAKKLSRGLLMGARGNSGVILSQLFRGIFNGFQGYEEVDAPELARALASGVAQAYKAVMKPVEGTILTVAREAAEKMVKIAHSNMSMLEFFDEYIAELKASLQRTPDLLAVLKESNVVDSGGAGFLVIIEGMRMALKGDFISIDSVHGTMHTASVLAIPGNKEAEFGYCTEFILQLSEEKVDSIDDFEENMVLEKIQSLGDSIVVVKDEDIVKVHIHTLTPGDVLNIAQTFGEFVTLKIENMTVQHNEITSNGHDHEHPHVHAKPAQEEVVVGPKKKYAILTVATGKGLINTFKEIGADYIVEGGQSMNPSTEDFIKGYESLNAENIIVFPNNKNILLAARQSAKMYRKSKVHVVETKTLAQGFSALTMLDLNGAIGDIMADIQSVINNVVTGQITYAVRDTDIGGLTIKKDDYIAILDGKIIASKRRRQDAFKELLMKVDTEEKEIITIIHGEGVPTREINELIRFVEKNYSNLEVDVIEGNQEVYSYILAIE